MRALGKETYPNVSLYPAKANSFGAGLLRVAEDDAGGFGCRLRSPDGNFSGGVALTVVKYLKELGFRNNASLSLAAKHMLDRDERRVIYLFRKTDKQAASLADKVHGQHTVTFDKAEWYQH